MLTLTQKIIIGIFMLGMIYLLSKLLKKEDKEFDKLYKDVLTSSKYKVKGRFEE